MMVMTAKFDLKKVILMAAGAAALVMALVLLLGDKPEPTAAAALSDNDRRVKFLTDFGWEVVPSPRESSQVKIPQEAGRLFARYNNLQKAQGYDLTGYAGKKVMRYVYEVTNYPGAKEPVYATVLVCKNKIIGGDITATGSGGKIRPFRMPGAGIPSEAPSAAPSESTLQAGPGEPSVNPAP